MTAKSGRSAATEAPNMATLETSLGPLLLEPARPEELALVMGILDECAGWLHGRGIAQWALPQPPHEWEKMRVQIALGHVTLARLEVDRSIVGTLRVEWEDAHLWPDDPTGGGYVHALAVRNHIRGHGIGARLLDWAQAHIAAQGREYIRLDCWDKNARLCRYYESLGFRPCGHFTAGDWTGALYEKEAAP